jgi:YjbE family integral membrane protein
MLEEVLGWFAQNWAALLNVIMIDIVLAGDNAIIVGLAASQVAPELRARVIFWGIAGAVILRILFAGITAQLLAITGIMLFGGLLLFYVCWKMYDQLRSHAPHAAPHSVGATAAATAEGADNAQVRNMGFWAALWQIIVADVSMSLDNVLAVAGAAKGSTLVLVIGLAVAIILMAVASHYIAGLLVRYPWISWVGLIVIFYVAIDMLLSGAKDVACKVYSFSCDAGTLAFIQNLSEATWKGLQTLWR